MYATPLEHEQASAIEYRVISLVVQIYCINWRRRSLIFFFRNDKPLGSVWEQFSVLWVVYLWKIIEKTHTSCKYQSHLQHGKHEFIKIFTETSFLCSGFHVIVTRIFRSSTFYENWKIVCMCVSPGSCVKETWVTLSVPQSYSTSLCLCISASLPLSDYLTCSLLLFLLLQLSALSLSVWYVFHLCT